jgi:hypothetical protein
VAVLTVFPIFVSPFKFLLRCLQDKQEIGPRWQGWLADAKKKLDTLDQVWLLVKTHVRHFNNTVTEMEKEKLSKKLQECKCSQPRQQVNLLNIMREIALHAHESGIALKWCLELINSFLDSKTPKYPFNTTHRFCLSKLTLDCAYTD